MGGIPDLMFVIDTNKEAIAIQEARKLNIPVVAILDTNCDPQGITYPIPGNDDAARALQLYCDLIADAVLDGLTEGPGRDGCRYRRGGNARRTGAADERQPGSGPYQRRGRPRAGCGCGRRGVPGSLTPRTSARQAAVANF